jgi:bifunctional non-homologous end joining protein LigD
LSSEPKRGRGKSGGDAVSPGALPAFVPPMLAVTGLPFDSAAHFFEYKWDGFRASAMVEGGTLRLMSRKGLDLAPRFQSLSELSGLPNGTILDGEIVAFKDGKPDFEQVLKGEAARFVAFDVLYTGYQSLLALPFVERRTILEELISENQLPPLALSEGFPGKGKALYQRACEQGLEGVMAKKLSSPYAAGKRNGAWIKIKRRLQVQAAIIGYIEKGKDDFQCLLVACSGLPGEEGGALRFVGRVGGGFTEAVRTRINVLLREHPRGAPLVACPERGKWVEPGLYCALSYAEMTEAGVLRAPVFEGLIEA